MTAELVRGMSVVTFSLVVTRALSLVAQLALGHILSPEEFGLYALAIGLAAIAQALRDGGTPLWLISQGAKEYRVIAGSAFVTALRLNALLCVMLVGSAWLIAHAYHEPDLAFILVVIGASLPLGTWASLTQASLQLELRFRALSAIQAASAFLRYSIMISLALWGAGALSFVIPTLFAYAFEGVAGMALTGGIPRGERTSAWTVLRLTRWPIALSVAIAIANQIDFVLVGALAGLTAVGYYYFAYQIAYQLAGLISDAAQRVLTAALRHVRGDPLRHNRGMLAAMSMNSIVAAPGLLLLGSLYPLLAQVAWGDRWTSTVGPTLILTAGLPLHLLVVVSNAALISQERFRTNTILVLVKALLVGLAAAGSALAAPKSAFIISTTIAVAMAAASLIQLRHSANTMGLAPSALAAAVARPLTCSGSAYAFSAGIALLAEGRLALLAPPLTFTLLYLALMHRQIVEVMRQCLSSHSKTASE